MIPRAGLLLGICLGLLQMAEAQEPPVLVSPDVRQNRTIVFRFWAPRAIEVQLSGDWMGGSPVPLTKDSQGISIIENVGLDSSAASGRQPITVPAT